MGSRASSSSSKERVTVFGEPTRSAQQPRWWMVREALGRRALSLQKVMPLTVGSRLGHYSVIALIGEGGIGLSGP